MDELAVAMKARDFIAKCGPLALRVSVTPTPHKSAAW